MLILDGGRGLNLMPNDTILEWVLRPFYFGLGLETFLLWPWSRELVTKVLVSRAGNQGLSLSKVLITSLSKNKPILWMQMNMLPCNSAFVLGHHINCCCC